MGNLINIAICQNRVVNNKEKNLARVKNQIEHAVGKGADLIILPEMFNCPYDNRYFTNYAEKYPGKTTKFLSSLSRNNSVYIIGGSIPEKDIDKIYNTSFIFDRYGDLIAKHRKIHLFDVEIEGGINFKESETFSAGNSFTVFDTSLCRIGVAICYDMRFPELIRKMTAEGAELIIIPAAFNMTTGPAHWHIITRTRAVDNQVFFIAASPARNKKASYIAYGHSLVINPWGEIIAEAGSGEEVLVASIDLGFILKIRNELPLLKQKKEEY
jgi:predicted amidohydrolase